MIINNEDIRLFLRKNVNTSWAANFILTGPLNSLPTPGMIIIITYKTSSTTQKIPSYKHKHGLKATKFAMFHTAHLNSKMASFQGEDPIK